MTDCRQLHRHEKMEKIDITPSFFVPRGLQHVDFNTYILARNICQLNSAFIPGLICNYQGTDCRMNSTAVTRQGLTQEENCTKYSANSGDILRENTRPQDTRFDFRS